MTPPTRPALRYHGGKWRLAPWIISHFPQHRVYVEPFGGGASVLLRKPRSYAEVYNDLDGEVVNVFRVLRDQSLAAEMERALRLTPFAREEFAAAYKPSDDPVERARRALVRSYMGFGSAGFNAAHSTGFRHNTRRPGTTPAQDWANYPEQVQHFTERFASVVIDQRNAMDLLPIHDGQDTLFYVDPPYPHSTRGAVSGVRQKYRHEMTDDQHRELAQALHEIKGMVVLSGYPCALYDQELYPDWHRVERQAMADGARNRMEVLWLNAATAKGLGDNLFGVA